MTDRKVTPGETSPERIPHPQHGDNLAGLKNKGDEGLPSSKSGEGKALKDSGSEGLPKTGK